MSFVNKNYFIFAILFLLCGLYSVEIGVDGTMELLFYHYWNGYSFVTRRYLENLDFAFCGVQSYFNPLFDAGFYILSKWLNNFPRLFLFLQGFFPACSLFFLYKIVAQLILYKKYKIFCCIFTLTFAMSSILFFYQIGTSLIDLQLCCFPLAALFLFFKYSNSDEKKQYFLAAGAGMLLGFSVGFKLTYAMYGLAFFISLCFNYKTFKNPLVFLILWLAGAFSGYMIVNGFWAFYLLKTFGNPFFPFYNNIFHSSYSAFLPYKAVNCLPDSILEWIAYPFFWYAKNDAPKVFMMPYNNLSWVIVYCMVLFYLFSAVFQRVLNINYFSSLSKIVNIKAFNFLIVFLTLSYCIWLYSFSVLRYAILMDMFIGFIIFIFVLYLFSFFNKKFFCYLILSAIFIFQAANMKGYYTWPRKAPENILFFAEDKKIPDNSVVFSAGFPVSFAGVFQNPKSHYVYGFNDPRLHFEYSEKSAEIVNQWILQNPDNLYAIFGKEGYGDFFISEDNEIYSGYFIDKESCKIINNNFISLDNWLFVALCKIVPE